MKACCHSLSPQWLLSLSPIPGATARPRRASKVQCTNPLFTNQSVNMHRLSACSSLCGPPLHSKKEKEETVKRADIPEMFCPASLVVTYSISMADMQKCNLDKKLVFFPGWFFLLWKKRMHTFICVSWDPGSDGQSYVSDSLEVVFVLFWY